MPTILQAESDSSMENRTDSNPQAIRPLAQDGTVIYRSPDGMRIHAYSPGICTLPSGRLIATNDLGGPGVTDLPGPKSQRGALEGQHSWQGNIFISDDHGSTWQQQHSFPFMHARPLRAGNSLYVIGQANDLMIIRSDDDGETWSEPRALSQGQHWHQAPSNVHYAHDSVYLVMERRCHDEIKTWSPGANAPVLMRARCDSDLCQRANWTFASELCFSDIIPGIKDQAQIDFSGVPFYHAPYPGGVTLAPGRNCAPSGWLEANVVQFHDPRHIWHDPTGKTFYLWLRSHVGLTNYACIAKVTEQGNEAGTGEMITELVSAPSGKNMLFVPCPGGHNKFHVIYDNTSKRYWLVSVQSTDSMCRPELLADDRFGIPLNQRCRLQLHFSSNMIDWCFAGMVTIGAHEKDARQYPAMCVDGDDLLIVSRSSDGVTPIPNAHDGNLTTLHRIPQFRNLVY